MKLSDYRLAAGKSQAQLAKDLGVQHTMISQWERGVRIPTIVSAVRLAAALGLHGPEKLGEFVMGLFTETTSPHATQQRELRRMNQRENSQTPEHMTARRPSPQPS